MKSLIVALAAVAAGAAVAGGNLIANGDFESGKADGWSGWGGGESRIVETSPHSGKCCFAFEHRTSQKGGWRVRRISAKPSSVYTVSGYIRGDAGKLQVEVLFYDAKGKYISEKAIFLSASAPDWMHFEKAITTPDNAANIWIGLHVEEGIGYIDDLSIVEGDCVKSVVNEILNSSFEHSLHDSGLPTYWNSGGGLPYGRFIQGVHEGRYFRIAPEEKSPVPGTKVMFVDQVNYSEFMTGMLAGDKDYVFSVYMRSDKEGAKVKLGTIGGGRKNISPGEMEFALTKEWQRLVMPFRLIKNASHFYATVMYQKNPVYMAAPMLHIGREPVAWRPNPADANLPDLRKGRAAEAVAQSVRELTIPEVDDSSRGVTIDEFHPLGGGEVVRGKYRAAFRQSEGSLVCDIECDSGAKPSVPRKNHAPLVAGNDAAEIFISPSETGVPYVQFMGGRNGDFDTTLGGQENPMYYGWTYEAAETEKGWRCTYRIPLSLFKKSGGKAWRLNVGVTDFAGLKARHFSATEGGFHEPRKYLIAKGLPQDSQTASPRIAAERDLYVSGEDVVRVRAYDVQGAATVRLLDESGKVVFSRVEHVDRVDIADLPNGYYRIEIAAENGKAETHFRKNVAAKSHSRVNRFTKNIEVDGRPFFPMVYTWLSRRADMPTEWHISELKKRNFNTILFTMETFGPRFGYTPDDRRRLLRIFADAGFRFILWTNADIKKSGTFAVAEAHRKYLGELGAELLDRVVGWYYLDEIAPVYWEKHFNIRESDIAPGYRADKAVDPDRLHFINWNCSNVVEGQKFFAEDGATDLYSLDSYPYRNSINYGALAAFERAANAIGHRIDNASLPGIMWLQTYSYQEGLREPMPVEYRNNVYVGLVNHVSGFMNFIGCPENGDLWDEMGRAYGTALKWLEMTVQPGAKRLSKGKVGNIAYALWERGDGGYGLVAVNTSYSPQKETLSFGVEFGKSNELIGGEGNLSIGKTGTLAVSLPVAGSAAWFIGEWR